MKKIQHELVDSAQTNAGAYTASCFDRVRLLFVKCCDITDVNVTSGCSIVRHK